MTRQSMPLRRAKAPCTPSSFANGIRDHQSPSTLWVCGHTQRVIKSAERVNCTFVWFAKPFVKILFPTPGVSEISYFEMSTTRASLAKFSLSQTKMLCTKSIRKQDRLNTTQYPYFALLLISLEHENDLSFFRMFRSIGACSYVHDG